MSALIYFNLHVGSASSSHPVIYLYKISFPASGNCLDADQARRSVGSVLDPTYVTTVIVLLK